MATMRDLFTYVRHARTRLGVALLSGAAMVTAACGDQLAPSGGDPAAAGPGSETLLTTCCPCDDELEGPQVDAIVVAGHRYAVPLDETRFVVDQTSAGGGTWVATQVDPILSWTAAKIGGSPRCYVVGCGAAGPRLEVYGDTNADGIAAELLGASELSNARKLIALAVRKDGVLFAIDGIAGEVVTLTDTDADDVPDQVATFIAASSTALVDDPADLWHEPNGVLLVSGMWSPGSLDELTVAVDADLDGSADTVSRGTGFEFWYTGPVPATDPLIGSSSVTVHARRGADIELWETDATGAKLSSDPVAHRLGAMTASASSVESTMAVSPALVGGSHYRFFDTTHDKAGAVFRPLAASVDVTSVQPGQVRYDLGGVITVTGQGLSGTPTIELVKTSGEVLALTMVPGSSTGTSVQATIPVLGSDWIGMVSVRVTSQVEANAHDESSILITKPTP